MTMDEMMKLPPEQIMKRIREYIDGTMILSGTIGKIFAEAATKAVAIAPDNIEAQGRFVATKAKVQTAINPEIILAVNKLKDFAPPSDTLYSNEELQVLIDTLMLALTTSQLLLVKACATMRKNGIKMNDVPLDNLDNEQSHDE